MGGTVLNQRGLGVLLVMTSLVLLFSGIASGFMFFGQMQNRRVLARLDGREGFYASELAAWYRAENQIAGNTNYAGGDGTGSGVPLTLDYTQGTRNLAGTSYNGSSYNDGDPINISTTDEFLPSHSFIRRDKGNNVYYYSPTAGSAYCGEMKFTKDASSVCLTGNSTAQIAPTCSAATVSWFTGPTPDCTNYPGYPLVAAQYQTLSALPAQPIASITDYNNMILSNQSYYLKADLDFGGPCPTKNLVKIFFDGRGHNIKCAGTLFNEISSSVVENLTATGNLSNAIEGNTCVNHVGLNAAGFTGETGQLTQSHTVIANSWVQGDGGMSPIYGGDFIATVWPGASVSLIRDTACGTMMTKTTLIGGSQEYGGLISQIAYAKTGSTTVQIDQSFYSGSVGPASALLAGGLVGFAEAFPALSGAGTNGSLKITRSGFYGTVHSTGGTAGGLVASGYNISIDQSFFKGTINAGFSVGGGYTATAGGLVGEENGATSITRSFAVAPPGQPLVASGNRLHTAGGIIGYMDERSNIATASTPTLVSDSFVEGQIFQGGFDNGALFGGLVGAVNTPCPRGCSIKNSFFAGTLTIQSAVNDPANMIGGISPYETNLYDSGTGVASGAMTPSPLNGANNFWDSMLTPNNFTANCGPFCPLATAQMQGSSSNYTGFDFTNTWQWNQGAYPTLQWWPTP